MNEEAMVETFSDVTYDSTVDQIGERIRAAAEAEYDRHGHWRVITADDSTPLRCTGRYPARVELANLRMTPNLP